MSAFVVSNETIHRCVSALAPPDPHWVEKWAEYKEHNVRLQQGKRTRKIINPVDWQAVWRTLETAGQKLGRDLLKLNCDAVVQRYPCDHHDMTQDEQGRWYYETYTYRPVNGTPIEKLKALDCLIYQCSEGDVPETELYKRLVKVSDELHAEIAKTIPSQIPEGAIPVFAYANPEKPDPVRSTAAYNKAPWDWRE